MLTLGVSVLKTLVCVIALAGLASLAVAQGPVEGNCLVFPADNIWKARIDQLPVNSSSSAWVSTIGVSSPHCALGSSLLSVFLRRLYSVAAQDWKGTSSGFGSAAMLIMYFATPIHSPVRSGFPSGLSRRGCGIIHGRRAEARGSIQKLGSPGRTLDMSSTSH